MKNLRILLCMFLATAFSGTHLFGMQTIKNAIDSVQAAVGKASADLLLAVDDTARGNVVVALDGAIKAATPKLKITMNVNAVKFGLKTNVDAVITAFSTLLFDDLIKASLNVSTAAVQASFNNFLVSIGAGEELLGKLAKQSSIQTDKKAAENLAKGVKQEAEDAQAVAAVVAVAATPLGSLADQTAAGEKIGEEMKDASPAVQGVLASLIATAAWAVAGVKNAIVAKLPAGTTAATIAASVVNPDEAAYKAALKALTDYKTALGITLGTAGKDPAAAVAIGTAIDAVVVAAAADLKTTPPTNAEYQAGKAKLDAGLAAAQASVASAPAAVNPDEVAYKAARKALTDYKAALNATLGAAGKDLTAAGAIGTAIDAVVVAAAADLKTVPPTSAEYQAGKAKLETGLVVAQDSVASAPVPGGGKVVPPAVAAKTINKNAIDGQAGKNNGLSKIKTGGTPSFINLVANATTIKQVLEGLLDSTKPQFIDPALSTLFRAYATAKNTTTAEFNVNIKPVNDFIAEVGNVQTTFTALAGFANALAGLALNDFTKKVSDLRQDPKTGGGKVSGSFDAAAVNELELLDVTDGLVPKTKIFIAGALKPDTTTPDDVVADIKAAAKGATYFTPKALGYLTAYAGQKTTMDNAAASGDGLQQGVLNAAWNEIVKAQDVVAKVATKNLKIADALAAGAGATDAATLALVKKGTITVVVTPPPPGPNTAAYDKAAKDLSDYLINLGTSAPDLKGKIVTDINKDAKKVITDADIAVKAAPMIQKTFDDQAALLVAELTRVKGVATDPANQKKGVTKALGKTAVGALTGVKITGGGDIFQAVDKTTKESDITGNLAKYITGSALANLKASKVTASGKGAIQDMADAVVAKSQVDLDAAWAKIAKAQKVVGPLQTAGYSAIANALAVEAGDTDAAALMARTQGTITVVATPPPTAPDPTAYNAAAKDLADYIAALPATLKSAVATQIGADAGKVIATANTAVSVAGAKQAVYDTQAANLVAELTRVKVVATDPTNLNVPTVSLVGLPGTDPRKVTLATTLADITATPANYISSATITLLSGYKAKEGTMNKQPSLKANKGKNKIAVKQQYFDLNIKPIDDFISGAGELSGLYRSLAGSQIARPK